MIWIGAVVVVLALVAVIWGGRGGGDRESWGDNSTHGATGTGGSGGSGSSGDSGLGGGMGGSVGS
jgi:hypothetical protein